MPYFLLKLLRGCIASGNTTQLFRRGKCNLEYALQRIHQDQPNSIHCALSSSHFEIRWRKLEWHFGVQFRFVLQFYQRGTTFKLHSETEAQKILNWFTVQAKSSLSYIGQAKWLGLIVGSFNATFRLGRIDGGQFSDKLQTFHHQIVSGKTFRFLKVFFRKL